MREPLKVLSETVEEATFFARRSSNSKFPSIVKVNATLLFFEGDFGWGVAFSLTKRCV